MKRSSRGTGIHLENCVMLVIIMSTLFLWSISILTHKGMSILLPTINMLNLNQNFLKHSYAVVVF